MDEIETVSRRDAITGLSVLGALLLAVVGTIFYKIIVPTPAGRTTFDQMATSPTPQPNVAENIPPAESPSSPIASHRDDHVGVAAAFENAPPRPTERAPTPKFLSPESGASAAPTEP